MSMIDTNSIGPKEGGSMKMRTVRLNDIDGNLLCWSHWVWCPGCDEAHRFQSAHPDAPPVGSEFPLWTWDGHEEAPTFDPSYLTWTSNSRCHSYLKGGMWQFLSDCTHSLANQTVEMVELPDWLQQQ